MALKHYAINSKHTAFIVRKIKRKNWKSRFSISLGMEKILNIEGYFVQHQHYHHHQHRHLLHRMESHTRGGWIFFCCCCCCFFFNHSSHFAIWNVHIKCSVMLHIQIHVYILLSYPSRTNFQSTKLNYYDEWTAPTNFFVGLLAYGIASANFRNWI